MSKVIHLNTMRMHPTLILKKWAALLDYMLLMSVAFIEQLDTGVRIVGGVLGIFLTGFLIKQILAQNRISKIDYEIRKRDLEIKDHQLHELMQRSKQLPEKKKKAKQK